VIVAELARVPASVIGDHAAVLRTTGRHSPPLAAVMAFHTAASPAFNRKMIEEFAEGVHARV
jgi:hypothetical protein